MLGRTRVVGLGASVEVVDGFVDCLGNRELGRFVDGIVEGGTMTVLAFGIEDSSSLNVRSVIVVHPIKDRPLVALGRSIEICEEGIEAQDGNLAIVEEDEILVIIWVSVRIRPIIVAVVEAAVIEIRLESRCR